MDARTVRHPAPLLVKLDVIGEAEELRAAAAGDAGRSSARRDLSVLLDRGLRTRTIVALSRGRGARAGRAPEGGGFRTDLALLQEALREALEDAPP